MGQAEQSGELTECHRGVPVRQTSRQVPTGCVGPSSGVCTRRHAKAVGNRFKHIPTGQQQLPRLANLIELSGFLHESLDALDEVLAFQQPPFRSERMGAPGVSRSLTCAPTRTHHGEQRESLLEMNEDH
jgi:hypothetical protein